jgi:hypothetical protein
MLDLGRTLRMALLDCRDLPALRNAVGAPSASRALDA